MGVACYIIVMKADLYPRNYVFSVIVGFVAITYGSVPMYKMVFQHLSIVLKLTIT